MTATLEDNNRTEVNVATERGTVLNGVLFKNKNPSNTLLISITGILGNFYTNPFYYNLGETMTNTGYDFLYAQTNDAFEKMKQKTYIQVKKKL